MASENVKFLDTTEARADIIECKGGMEFAFPPDDDRVSRLLVRSSDHHTQHNAPRELGLIRTGEDMSILPS